MFGSSIIRDGDEIVFAKICSVTNEKYILKVPVDLVTRWQDGEAIQNVFPMLTPDDREFILSGLTPAEWDEMVEGDEGKGKI